MNILIFCKRRPQQKDLWEQPNGRFYHLAKYLAAAGHNVDLLLLGYDSDSRPPVVREGITWHCIGLLPAPWYIYTRARQVAAERHPDWVIGFSDAWFGILAVFLAGRLGVKSLVDAYDNYESYMPWCKPLHWLWRSALRRSDILSAPGHYLLKKMSQNGKDGQRHIVLPMTADPRFQRREQASVREALNLPKEKKLVGYCGSVEGARDMAMFFAAISMLAYRHPDYAFVMTGRLPSGLGLPPQVMHLGYLPDEKMPLMVSALDAVVALNKPSAFGSYSYPVKIYEALACGVPVIATETPSVVEILGEKPGLLVPPGDAGALATRLECLLEGNQSIDLPAVETWQSVARRLENLLSSVSQ